MASRATATTPRKPATHGLRPIRELVCPDIEEPMQHPCASVEKRRSHRYARRLPGTLSADGIQYPVTCRDIGYGGIRVDATRTTPAKPGQTVSVRIDLPGRSFQDALSIRATSPTPQGTALHLAL